ncbi:hypothetical protein [Rothia nasimurium]|uniref:hypothetical protein n=1 Tax=Rothia nasimurium TaxID=85336 RepID=UPI003C6E418A
MPQLNDAQKLLTTLGFDRQRTNVMAARTLLALAQLNFEQDWAEASNPRMGVRSIMDWMRQELGGLFKNPTHQLDNGPTTRQPRG